MHKKAPFTKNKGKGNISSMLNELKSLTQSFYITKVPSYGNTFFFTIGIYLLELFGVLAVSGMVMLIFGPFWWDTTTWGTFFRSLHIWAAEAFVTLLLLHVFVNFSTSAFKKKKLVWMIGAVLLLLVFLEYAFGVGLQGDFVAQWNAKAGADLWNGLGLGFWINPLNYGALLGWHVAILPIILALLIFLHYMLVQKKGLSTPYRKDIKYKMVEADHKKMYRRMVYILVIVLLFAVFLRAPYITPLTTTSIAQNTPNLFALTLIHEFTNTSGTATYFDTIQPYTFSTSKVYVTYPYSAYTNASGSQNRLLFFYSENPSSQNATINEAYTYFEANGSIENGINSNNSIVSVMSTLTKLAQSGIYGPVLRSEQPSSLDETYEIRFFADSRVLYSYSKANGLRTSQFGMIKLGNQWWQIGSYWMAPYNLLEIWFPNNTDFDNGVIALIVFLVLMFFPFIPYLNKLPDKLRLYKLFWNRFTIPGLRNKKKR